jgi:long-chain acyl-CoA synthetase
LSPPPADGIAPRTDGESVLDALFASARRFPSRTAIRRGPDALTYDGLRREIESRAESIRRSPEWVSLEAADPVAFVVDFFAARLAGRGSIAHGAQIPRLLRERREALLRRWRPPSGTPRTLFFSSGSVGEGKPAPLSDRELLAAALGYPDPPEIDSSDRVAVGASTAHVFGFVRGTLHPLLLGAEIVYYVPRRDPLGEAEALGGTVVLLPGPLVTLSARTSRPVRLKAVFSGGGALTEESVAAVEARRGAPVRLGYGLTESAGLGSRQRLARPRRAGTCGIAAPGLAISIVDPESGAELPAGRAGVIRMAGAAVFDGYADPDAANPFDERGRLDTGDLGFFDDEGELVVRGRREFSIVTQGRTVCAEEIENAIAEHPGISDVAVTPQDDSFAILFVAREGAATLDADIRAFLQERLPPFARPRKVISVDELPRNASGKLDRRIIASWLR